MVGVPGRSKGCGTCRRRRVKCDEGKPTCFRCLKAGFECLGYDRNTIWRHRSTAPFTKSSTSTDTSAPLSALRTQSIPLKQQGKSDAAQGPQHYLGLPTTRARCVSPPMELSLTAFQDDFCFAHMFSNFVWRAYGNLWLSCAAGGKVGSLSLDASKAMAQAHFGRTHKQAAIEHTGQKQYGKCLNSLATRLSDAATAVNTGKHELIIPILVLLMHASSLADRTASVFHLTGLARLLYLCGPEAFQEQPYLNAFESARATLTITALISRRRLFLEEARWQTAPWAANPEGKSAQSYLLDILVAVPGFLSDQGSLQDVSDESDSESQAKPDSPPSVPSSATTLHFDERSPKSEPEPPVDPALLHADLVERVRSKLLVLYHWRWRWQAQSGHEVSVDTSYINNKKAAAALGSIGSPRRLDRVRFSRFGASVEIILYNAVLMWLVALLWKLEPLKAGDVIDSCAERARTMAAAERCGKVKGKDGAAAEMPPKMASFEPLRRPGSAVSVRDPAMEICRVFEWQTRHHASNGEPSFLYLFPVGMAMAVLDEDEGLRRWIQGLLDTSPITSGYAGSSAESVQVKNVAGFGFYVNKEAIHPERVQTEERLYLTRRALLAGVRRRLTDLQA